MKKQKPNNLSLCNSCYCMTKTIKGNCGKCGKQKPNNSDESWTDRFDKNFIFREGMLEGVYRITRDGIKDIKSFISSELQREREEALDKGYYNGYRNGQKEEREKVLEEVKEIIGEDEDIEKDGKNWLVPKFEIPLRNQLRHELLSKVNNLKGK